MLAVALLTLLCMGAAATVSLANRRLPARLALLATAGMWLLVDKPVEGPVLARLSQDHGLTVSDLLSVAAVAVAVHTGRR